VLLVAGVKAVEQILLIRDADGVVRVLETGPQRVQRKCIAAWIE
jgi:hypothetical protein